MRIKLKYNIIILLIIYQNVVAKLVIPKDIYPENKICLEMLIKHLFNLQKPFVIIEKSGYKMHPETLKYIVKETYTIQEFNKSENSLQIIALLDTVDDYFISKLSSFKDGKIIIIGNSQKLNTEDITKYFLKFWKTGRHKLAIMITQRNKDSVLIHNFNIQDKFICSKQMYYRVSKSICQFFSQTSQKLWSKQGKNICQLNVIQINGETLAVHKNGNNIGIINKIMSTYAKLRGIEYNIGKNYSELCTKDFLNSGNIHNILASLKNGTFDVATGTFFLRYDFLDYGPILLKDKYVIATKKIQEQNKNIYLRVFHGEVWQWWIITFATSIVFYYILFNVSSYTNVAEKLSVHIAFFDILSLSAGGGFSTTAKANSLRIFLSFYLLASLIVYTTYSGKISSSLTLERFAKVNDKRLYTLTSSNSKMEYSTYMNNLYDIDNVIRRRLDRRPPSEIDEIYLKRNYTEWDNLKKMIFEEKNSSVVTLESLHKAHPSEAELIDIFVPEQPFSWFLTIYISRESLLKNSIQYWTTEMFEKGFTKKWINDIIESNRNYSILSKEIEAIKPISLNNLRLLFIGLLATITVAIMVFLMEHLVYQMDTRFTLKEKIIELIFLLKPPELESKR